MKSNTMYFYTFPDYVPDDESLCIVAVNRGDDFYYMWAEFVRGSGKWTIYDDDGELGDGRGATVTAWLSPKEHHTRGVLRT